MNGAIQSFEAALNSNWEELQLLGEAAARRDARNYRELMVVNNAAFNANEDRWKELQSDLMERSATGLFKYEPPARDPNLPPPKARSFKHKK